MVGFERRAMLRLLVVFGWFYIGLCVVLGFVNLDKCI